MLTPKPYLSFSQMALFEISPQKYAEQYIYRNKQRISRNMAYGSQLATALEVKEMSGDPLLDLMMVRLPKYELMDQPITGGSKTEKVWFERDKKDIFVPVLEDKNGNIPLLGLPDTAKKSWQAFKEYKTSVRNWTQKMADESGQITFYSTIIWIAFGIKPEDQEIELINVPVKYNSEGRLTPTNELIRLPTKRTIIDALKMISRIRNNWLRIKELCQKELF